MTESVWVVTIDDEYDGATTQPVSSLAAGIRWLAHRIDHHEWTRFVESIRDSEGTKPSADLHAVPSETVVTWWYGTAVPLPDGRDGVTFDGAGVTKVTIERLNVYGSDE